MTELTVGTARVMIVRGDITTQDVDAIVNAANPSLMGGGGVDGAIHRAGGPAILEECRAIRRERGDLPTGEAVITSGGRLPARYVIHTVGPVWHGGAQGEDDLLARAYKSSLDLAALRNLRSIAFPSISTGVYGFPVERAAPIALATVIRHLQEVPRPGEVRLVLYSAHDLNIYTTHSSGHAGIPPPSRAAGR